MGEAVIVVAIPFVGYVSAEYACGHIALPLQFPL